MPDQRGKELVDGIVAEMNVRRRSIYADAVTALVYRRGRAVGDVSADEDLDGGDVVPDFPARLRDLLPAGSLELAAG